MIITKQGFPLWERLGVGLAINQNFVSPINFVFPSTDSGVPLFRVMLIMLNWHFNNKYNTKQPTFTNI